jgi:hypothetical protein
MGEKPPPDGDAAVDPVDRAVEKGKAIVAPTEDDTIDDVKGKYALLEAKTPQHMMMYQF